MIKTIYEDPSQPANTGNLLMDKVYWMIWTPARRQRAKAANKRAHEAAKAAKQSELRKQQKEAAQKRAAKEKIEILRLGKGNEALGTKRYQERMRKDGNAKAEKEAAEVSQDAKKQLEFWTWRLGEGKYYDKKMQAVDIEQPAAPWGYVSKSKMISIHHSCVMEALGYLLKEGVAKNPRITFKDDSQGSVHYSALVHLPTNEDIHITMMPVRPLNFVKHRKTPAEISGAITGFRMCEGKLYFCVNNMMMPNTHVLLPNKWEKFNKAAPKWIGSKRYEACPNHRVNVPLLLNIRDPKGIKSISWTDAGTKYTAVVQTHGKDLAYIKSLRGKSQAEKEADALKEMREAADRQKAQCAASARAHEFFAKQPGYNTPVDEIRRTFAAVEAGLHKKPNFCPIGRGNVTAANASWCSSCGKALH